jgi:hypothetical protein
MGEQMALYSSSASGREWEEIFEKKQIALSNWDRKASPFWIVRLPASPLAHDDNLKCGDCAPHGFSFATLCLLGLGLGVGHPWATQAPPKGHARATQAPRKGRFG